GATHTSSAGLGGGLWLLSVLLHFMDPLEAIPVHAVIQLASNSSRTVLLRQHVHWDVVWRFCILLVPAGVLGLVLADQMPVTMGRIAIAVFALLVVWWPASLAAISSVLGSGRKGFVPLGGIAGFLNIPFGVTGPAVAPMFRRHLTERTAIIATFGATQTAGHFTKIGLFAGDGFAYGDNVAVMGVGVVAVVAGSWIGTRLLAKVDEVVFGRIFRVTLTVVAIRVIVTAF
ncbi:MAG: sulfite exporter TauE/SafE family protein, partial [Actinomycetota bacterium]|nr:sulfite exporter TauE/SafE family protein [Actinomycetota bacterium]